MSEQAIGAEDSPRIFTLDDLDNAYTAVIRACNDEPDMDHSFIAQLQIALEELGLKTNIEPPIPSVESYRAQSR